MKKDVELQNVEPKPTVYNTPERIEAANALDTRIKGRLLDLIIALKEIYDNQYFRELGYDTLQGYCLNRLELGYRTSMRYIQIAERFDFSTDNLQHVATAPSKNVPIVDKLLALDSVKLEMLCKLADERIDEIKNTGNLTLKGETYSIDDLDGMKRHEVRNMVNDFLGIKKEKVKHRVLTHQDYIISSIKTLEISINSWIRMQPGGVVDEEVEKDLGDKLNALLTSIDEHIFPIKARLRNEARTKNNPYSV